LATLDGMTGAFVSRWPVLEEHPVAAGDLDAGGAVRDDSVARWVAAARSAYLDRCAALRRRQQATGLELQVESASLPPGASLGRRPAAVAVSAGVREVWPSSFAIAVRLRPDGGDRDVAVNGSVVMRLVDPASGEPRELGDEVRDELIALEHAAEHFN
jgi:acyl-CoA thioesterase FadM